MREPREACQTPPNPRFQRQNADLPATMTDGQSGWPDQFVQEGFAQKPDPGSFRARRKTACPKPRKILIPESESGVFLFMQASPLKGVCMKRFPDPIRRRGTARPAGRFSALLLPEAKQRRQRLEPLRFRTSQDRNQMLNRMRAGLAPATESQRIHARRPLDTASFLMSSPGHRVESRPSAHSGRLPKTTFHRIPWR